MTLAYINNQRTYILSLYPLFQLGNKKNIHWKNHFCSSPGHHPVFIQSDIRTSAPELHYKHWNRRTAHVLPPTRKHRKQRRMFGGFFWRIHVPRFTGTWVPFVPCSTYQNLGSSRDIFTKGWPRRTDCPEIGKVSYIKTTPSTRNRQEEL